MAICDLCKDDMERGVACIPRRYLIGGKWYQAIRSGEGMNVDKAQGSDACHDCLVRPGEYHHPGCDMEECPKCHGQMFVCDCKVDAIDSPAVKAAPERLAITVDVSLLYSGDTAIINGTELRFINVSDPLAAQIRGEASTMAPLETVELALQKVSVLFEEEKQEHEFEKVLRDILELANKTIGSSAIVNKPTGLYGMVLSRGKALDQIAEWAYAALNSSEKENGPEAKD